jgi:hypothetical protein
MSNPKRGELEIVLGEKKYKGKVTLDVIMRIERQMGKGIVKVAQSLSEADITTEEIIAIITPVVRGGGNDIKEADIKKDVWEAGLADGIRVCGEIIAQTLGAGEVEGNEEQAAALL